MAALHINKDNFQELVLNADIPVLVDFFATWCGPCKMIAPILEEIADEHPEIRVCKIDVDQESELTSQFGITSVPTLLVFRDGEMVSKTTGARPKQAILDLLN